MSSTEKIVYIGKKPFKKDTICGTRTIFKQGEATPVPAELVQRFLDFPQVWVAEKQAKGELERQKHIEAEKEKQRLALEEAEKQKQADMNMVITVDGEEVDLGKYSSNQLATFAEAHDLTIEGPKRPVAEYAKKIRDAFRALSDEGQGEGENTEDQE